jgi:hypothetical protein
MRLRLFVPWLPARAAPGISLHSVALLVALILGPAANAQTRSAEPALVISPKAETVSLSVYRSSFQAPVNSAWPSGYALISETRSVDLPVGEFVLRFEGVADGMFPESAIISGLPEGVREKNRDARLLSPAGLIDAYLQRSVHLRRTNLVTGAVQEVPARISAAPNGAVVLHTKEGYEALNCTGLPERMVFASVPANLSAKPTLSVLATSTKAMRVKITLSYMAEGFDWQANYLTTVRSLKRNVASVDLMAWVTLINGGAQSFERAQTVVIAGAPNRVERDAPETEPGELVLRCWPSGRTHEVRLRQLYIPPPPASPLPYSPEDEQTLESIVVMGSRIKRSDSETASPAMLVEQEELGDLKLYRVPEPVTVNAKGQKQVAMMLKPGVKMRVYYAAEFLAQASEQPLSLNFRTENTKKNGLGLPLPKGQAELFEATKFGPLWLGASAIADNAVGEKLEFALAESSNVRMLSETLRREKTRSGLQALWRITLSNAKDSAVQAEIQIPEVFARKPNTIKNIDGVPTWIGTIPANDKTSFEFVLREGESLSRRAD